MMSRACAFSGGTSCVSAKLNSGNTLDLQIGQARGGTLRIVAVGCTKHEPFDGDADMPPLAAPVEIPNGESRPVTGAGTANTVQCTNEDRVPYAGIPGEWMIRGMLCFKAIDTATSQEIYTCGQLTAPWEG